MVSRTIHKKHWRSDVLIWLSVPRIGAWYNWTPVGGTMYSEYNGTIVPGMTYLELNHRKYTYKINTTVLQYLVLEYYLLTDIGLRLPARQYYGTLYNCTIVQI